MIILVFDRFHAAGLSLNLAKCEFGWATITYTLKIVRWDQIRTVNTKVEATMPFLPPTTRQDRVAVNKLLTLSKRRW